MQTTEPDRDFPYAQWINTLLVGHFIASWINKKVSGKC